MVRLLRPKPGELVQDPAAGTGGFIVAADRYIKDATDDLFKHDLFKLSPDQQAFQRTQAFVGLELVLDAHRLLLMNLSRSGVASMTSNTFSRKARTSFLA
jgi:type I restriction enzyme M protein